MATVRKNKVGDLKITMFHNRYYIYRVVRVTETGGVFSQSTKRYANSYEDACKLINEMRAEEKAQREAEAQAQQETSTEANKSVKSRVFTMAWGFIKRNGYSLSKALKTAWNNIKLSKAMKTQVVQFFYTKASTGETRQAFGTMKTDVVSDKIKGTGTRKASNDLITYYDTISEGFRSFKSFNLISVVL